MSYKQEKIIVIVSEFVNDKREYYPITDIPIEKVRFFYKDDDGLFKAMSSSDYAVRTETNEMRLYITNEKIKNESLKFQVGYEINFSASEYETSLPVLSVLVEMYNTLIEDSRTIFNYVKKQCFISDDKTTSLILPNLPSYTVWCMGENGEMFALPVNKLYSKFGEMLNKLKSILADYTESKKEEIRGATFFPHLIEDGTLSWTNDKNKPNPEPVNIKGPAGTIENVTASVNSNAGVPSVKVTMSGTKENRSFNLEFQNLKGDPAIKGVDYYTPEEKEQFTNETLKLVTAEGNRQISLTQAEALKVIEQLKKLIEGNPETSNAQALSGKTRVEFEQDTENVISLLNTLENEQEMFLRNAVDYDSMLTGKYYDGGGVLVENSYYKYSEKYFIIKPNTIYKGVRFTNSLISINFNFVICFYDKDKKFIKQQFGNHSYISPGNSVFMRICFNPDSTPLATKFMIFESPSHEYMPTEFYEYGYSTKPIEQLKTSIKTSINEATKDIEQSKDLFKQVAIVEEVLEPINNTTRIKGYFFDCSSFEQNGPYEQLWDYVKVPVKAGEKYKITSFCGQNARLWNFLDSDNKTISYSQDSALNQKTEDVIVPENAVLMIVNEKVSESSREFSILKYTTKAEIDTNKIRKMGNILYGKTLVCVGDSITEGADMEMGEGGFTNSPEIEAYSWKFKNSIDGIWEKQTSNVRMTYGYQIADRNNMKFYNGGMSGSTMQGLTERNGFSLENGRYTKLPENIDYLTIFFGWNDTAYGTLGTISDKTNNSYYGGYNVVLPYLIKKYPYTKICLIVPFGCDEGHRNAIRLLANKWGVACFDMYQGGTPLYFGKENDVKVENSIVEANKKKFQANGAHPNFRGHMQISNMLEHFLRGI